LPFARKVFDMVFKKCGYEKEPGHS